MPPKGSQSQKRKRGSTGATVNSALKALYVQTTDIKGLFQQSQLQSEVSSMTDLNITLVITDKELE